MKHGEIIKLYRKINSKYYSARRNIRKKENLLVNYPTIVLPNKLIIRVPFQEQTQN